MLKSLTGLFFEKEAGETKEKESKPNEETKSNGNGAEQSVAPPVSMAPTVGVNSEMAEMLAAAIEAANIEGFDYLEFRDSLVGMASIPMPEKQKFETVFATAKTMGVTADKLLSSIDHYQEVLDQKKAEFLAHVESITAAEVTAREQKKAENEQKITDAAAEIQRLTAEITELQQENLTITNEINTEKLNIQNTAGSFEATFGVVSGRLQEDKGKIQSYLAPIVKTGGQS